MRSDSRVDLQSVSGLVVAAAVVPWFKAKTALSPCLREPVPGGFTVVGVLLVVDEEVKSAQL